VLGALVATGLFLMIPGASAASGNGPQGALNLGSNSLGSAGVSGQDTPNVSSAATDLDASPNFGNYAAYGRYVFSVDATPSQIGGIDAIHAAGQGTGSGVIATSEQGAALVGETGAAQGAGVYALNPKGEALAVQGKAAFSRSGALVIKAGKASVGKSLPVGSEGLVLATIQGNVAGVYVQGVTRAKNSFTIHLNTKTPKDVAVAWFVLN
jgi:hypothetical protein